MFCCGLVCFNVPDLLQYTEFRILFPFPRTDTVDLCFMILMISLGKKGPKLTHTERCIYTDQTGCGSVCFVVVWGVSIDLNYSNTQNPLPLCRHSRLDGTRAWCYNYLDRERSFAPESFGIIS